MGLTETISDLVGKYSVTGVLKERLDFELARASAARDDAAKQLSLLTKENELLKQENAHLKSKLKDIEADRDNLRRQLDAGQQLNPPSELDIGAEITLASLMNNPSGITAARIARTFSGRPLSTNDVVVWIEEFREHNFVELALGDMGQGCEYRLTASGRKYARDYFARQDSK